MHLSRSLHLFVFMCALAAAGVLVHHRNGRSIDLSQREKYSKLNGMQAVQSFLRDAVPRSSCDDDEGCRRWRERKMDYFWSQEQYQLIGEQRKECLLGQCSPSSPFTGFQNRHAKTVRSDDAPCNVYDGDRCCENLYCHELPSFKGVCRLIGH